MPALFFQKTFSEWDRKQSRASSQKCDGSSPRSYPQRAAKPQHPRPLTLGLLLPAERLTPKRSGTGISVIPQRRCPMPQYEYFCHSCQKVFKNCQPTRIRRKKDQLPQLRQQRRGAGGTRVLRRAPKTRFREHGKSSPSFAACSTCSMDSK
jgi:hypothetical protein